MNYFGRPDPEDLCRTRKSYRNTFTNLEYIEMNSAEMKKFKYLEPISEQEIKNTDIESLTHQLQK